MAKNRRISPKAPPVEALPGTLHGPYWRHQWREGGQTRRRYVRRADVAQVRAALAAWQAAHPPAAALRQELVELRRLVRLLGV